MIGPRLGPNEITAMLGEVGKGEVYRAAETPRKRSVASQGRQRRHDRARWSRRRRWTAEPRGPRQR